MRYDLGFLNEYCGENWLVSHIAELWPLGPSELINVRRANAMIAEGAR